jgi:hypothetical protein
VRFSAPRRLLLTLPLAGIALLSACGGQAPQAAEPTAEARISATVPDGPTREQLPSLALTAADVPGFAVRREGYVAEGEIVVYRRAFSAGDALSDTTTAPGFSNEVILFSTAEAANESLAGMLAVLNSEAVDDYLGALVQAHTGFAPTLHDDAVVAVQKIGDGALVAHVSLDGASGPAEAVFAVVRVGRLESALLLLGPPGELGLDAAADMLGALVPRLQDAIGLRFEA